MSRIFGVILALGFGLLVVQASEAAFELSFSGEVDLAQKTVFISTVPGIEPHYQLKAAQVSKEKVELLLTAENVKTPLGKISTQLETVLDFAPVESSRTGVIAIELGSKYTLIDNKPAGELQGRLELSGKKLTINHLSSGNFRCEGFIEGVDPYPLDIKASWKEISFLDCVRLWESEKPIAAQGVMAGEARFSGSLKRLLLQGSIESFDGIFDELIFQRINLKWEGLFPVVQVVNSQVMQTDGLSFKVSGPLDFSDLKHMETQVDALKKEPLVQQDLEQREWTLKRSESSEKSGTTELKYIRRKDESVNTLSNEGGDLLGVQQKMKF